MTATVIYKGPTPPPGEKFCFVCAYTWKNAVNEQHAEEIEQAGKASEGTIMHIDGTQDDAPGPALAVAQGINAALAQFGVLDLCWSHVTAIRLQTASGLALPPPGGGMPMPPGFGMNGMGR